MDKTSSFPKGANRGQVHGRPRRKSGQCVNTTDSPTTSVALHIIVTVTVVVAVVYLAAAMSKFLAADNLPAWFPLHHFNQPVYNYKTGADIVDLHKKSLWAFVGMVAFNPIFWNIVARNGACEEVARPGPGGGGGGGRGGRSELTAEYRNKTITKIVRSPYVGCYILAVTIFSLSAFRDSL